MNAYEHLILAASGGRGGGSRGGYRGGYGGGSGGGGGMPTWVWVLLILLVVGCVAAVVWNRNRARD
ncbi:hypothetical protein HUT18_20260 [Streptomyces sp. NA04227]|uniref:hypothetical protein n=1 Tax=Streptomyces sp. NA04227 TaxID=2742136 RepID=UPI001590F619|nr:hypothetical protein [Streptomyces sp. NA04227]QKW08357.1 hypothetical protein HUT18_20260 [Streptomyces sp. NA04227]